MTEPAESTAVGSQRTATCEYCRSHPCNYNDNPMRDHEQCERCGVYTPENEETEEFCRDCADFIEWTNKWTLVVQAVEETNEKETVQDTPGASFSERHPIRKTRTMPRIRNRVDRGRKSSATAPARSRTAR